MSQEKDFASSGLSSVPGQPPLLFLVGNRGSGKSTAGRHLAGLLHADFIDLDHFLVGRAGRTIAQIVEADGWDEFRRLESDALRMAVVSSNNGLVVATGGGIVLSEANRAFMRANGLVIWLRIPVECAYARLAASPDRQNRPSLTGAGLLDELHSVFQERAHLYQMACSHVVAGDQACEKVCADILAKIGLDA